MKKIDILRQRLQELRRKQMDLYRQGKLIQGQKFNESIRRIEESIAELDLYEPKPLGELISQEQMREYNVCDLIIEMHMASDYLDDCAVELKSVFKKLGLEHSELFDAVSEISKKANEFASRVCAKEFSGLSELMMNNEELIDTLHNDCRQFLDDKLSITWKDQKEELNE